VRKQLNGTDCGPVLYGVNILVEPRNIVLDGGPGPPAARGGRDLMQPLPDYFGFLLFVCQVQLVHVLLICFGLTVPVPEKSRL